MEADLIPNYTHYDALMSCYIDDPSLLNKYGLNPDDIVVGGYRIALKCLKEFAVKGVIPTSITDFKNLEVLNGVSTEKMKQFERLLTEKIEPECGKHHIETVYGTELKYQMLRTLRKKGFDVSYYFADPDKHDANAAAVAEEHFENSSLEDIKAHYSSELSAVMKPYTLPDSYDPFLGYKVMSLPHADETHPWLVENLFKAGTYNLIQGPSKSGKSMLAYQICWCLQNGHDLFGNKVAAKNRCLYVDWELRQDQIKERFEKISEFYKVDLSKAEEYNVIPLSRKNFPFKITVDKLRQYLEAHPDINVVFLDNFYSFFEGNQNDATEVKSTLKELLTLSSTATFFLVCHTNKAVGQGGGSEDPLYAASGSNAFSAFCDEATSIQIKNSGANLNEVIIHTRGRDVFAVQKVACEFGPDTDFCFRYIEDESRITKVLSGTTKRLGKSREELERDYPNLASFIGEDGKTLNAIQKLFPNESTESLRDKGFWKAGKNKCDVGIGFCSGRYYLEDPSLNRIT